MYASSAPQPSNAHPGANGQSGHESLTESPAAADPEDPRPAAAATETPAPAGINPEVSALLSEFRQVVVLKMRLAQSEWMLSRAALGRMLLWIPLILLLVLALHSTVVAALWWATQAVTGSAALAFVVVVCLQFVALALAGLTVRRLFADVGFERSRKQLRASLGALSRILGRSA